MSKKKPHEAEQIGVNDLTNLVRRVNEKKKQARSQSGAAGEMIREACEFKKLDRHAFAMIMKFLALIEQGGGKASTSLACFDYYRDVLNIDDKAGKQGELAIARQEAGEKEAAEKKEPVGKFSSPKKDKPTRAAKGPSKASIKAIADRAEARSKSNVVPMAQAAE